MKTKEELLKEIEQEQDVIEQAQEKLSKIYNELEKLLSKENKPIRDFMDSHDITLWQKEHWEYFLVGDQPTQKDYDFVKKMSMKYFLDNYGMSPETSQRSLCVSAFLNYKEFIRFKRNLCLALPHIKPIKSVVFSTKDDKYYIRLSYIGNWSDDNHGTYYIEIDSEKNQARIVQDNFYTPTAGTWMSLNDALDNIRNI